MNVSELIEVAEEAIKELAESGQRWPQDDDWFEPELCSKEMDFVKAFSPQVVLGLLSAAQATTCPGHGRSECVSCCWPKGDAPLSGVELGRQLVEQVLSVMPENYAGHSFGVTAPDGSTLGDVIITVVKPDGKGPHDLRVEAESRVTELANLLTLAKHHVPLTDPLRGLINANLMQHLVEQDPWADFKDAAPEPASYTAVDMGTAAADGYRDGAANPELQMQHVAQALEAVRGGPVLTSNQCYDLARALNGIQRDRVKS